MSCTTDKGHGSITLILNIGTFKYIANFIDHLQLKLHGFFQMLLFTLKKTTTTKYFL